MNACTRRMHKGMPEMVAYILDECGECPEFFCSHPFRPLFILMLLAPWEEAAARREHGATAHAAALPEAVDLVFGDDDDDAGGAAQLRNARVDYECRPAELRQWPFYFFQAGVVAIPRSKSSQLLFTEQHPLHRKFALLVRTKTPWKVPLLYGPTVPSEDANPRRRAVLLQLQLRPWAKASSAL